MKQSINQYFQVEMQLLYEQSKYFSQAFPHQAAALGIDSPYDADPQVNRMMEGFAYLTGRVKQQIDMGVHQIGESVIRQLAPQYLVPYPSTTVVQFQGALSGRSQTVIPKGTTLNSPPVGDEQTVCQFQTVHDFDYLPVELKEVLPATSTLSTQGLRLNFRVVDASHEGVEINTLPLFINAPKDMAQKWLYFFMKHLTRISVLTKDGLVSTVPKGKCRMLAKSIRKPVRPSVNRGAYVNELLLDYFHCPDRFFFIQLSELDLVVKDSEFSLILHCNGDMPDMRISSDLLQSNCVPAVNVFSGDAEPITTVKTKAFYPLLMLNNKPESHQLYAIEAVTAMKTNSYVSQSVTEYYQHSSPVDEPTYRVHYHDAGQYHVKPYLHVNNLSAQTHCSIEAKMSNGEYPRRFISTRSLLLNRTSQLSGVQATNITKPTIYCQPTMDERYINQVVTLLNLRIQSFTDPQTLIHLFRMHNWQSQSYCAADAITSVQFIPFNQLKKGVMIRGLRAEVVLNQQMMTDISEAYLLGWLLHRLFYFYAPLNTDIETILQLTPSMLVMKWTREDLID